MKEAAGEANMTVVTIVLIAVVMAAGTLIVNSLMSGTRNRSACSSYGGTWYNGVCCTSPTMDNTGKVTGCGQSVPCSNGNCGNQTQPTG